MLAADALLARRFRLVRKLGEGGMGVVWSAVDETTNDIVALKFLREDALSESDAIRRFQREAKTAMRLAHPNVVRVREVIELEDGVPAMVMDLLDGESLAARLAREGALPVPEFARIFLQIISAVGSAHAAGIVHRDLKPDNVFLLGEGGEHDVRVLDFGIAKLPSRDAETATTALTGTGAMLGTPFYMAPEQVFGERDLDYRADIWALGVIMYECLSGRRPFSGDNFGQVFKAITRGELSPLSTLAPRLPRDLPEICARMLEVERGKRLGDLREVFDLVRKYTDVDAQLFAAPTLPSGSSRDDFADALAPTLADTGAALARSGKGSEFPRATSSPRWPYGVAAVLVAAIGATAWVISRAQPPSPAGSPSLPATSAVPVVVASPSPTPSPSPSVALQPSGAPSPSIAVVAPRPKVAPAPTPSPSPVVVAQPVPSATSLAGGVAPKPPF